MPTTLDIRRPSPFVAEPTEAFATLRADAPLRVIVLGGRRNALCAGAEGKEGLQSLLDKRAPSWQAPS